MTDISTLETCVHFRGVAHSVLRDMQVAVRATTYAELREKRDTVDKVERQIAGFMQSEEVKREVDVMNTMADRARMRASIEDICFIDGYALILAVALIDLAEARFLADSYLTNCDPPSMDMPDLPKSNTTTKDGDSDGNSGQTDDA